MNHDEPLTLEPPGTIAVVGAGPIGLEAALYGRYLGYDVRLIEANQVAWSWQDFRDDPMPMSPSDCVSNFAKDAIVAQRGMDGPIVMPMTVGAWIDDFLVPLSQSDLLSDRIIEGLVTHVDPVQVEPEPGDDSEDAAEDVPPDFRLTIDGPESTSLVTEALILTPADISNIQMGMSADADYLFRVVSQPDLVRARKQIVTVFASLGGRADLDLYRPLRGS